VRTTAIHIIGVPLDHGAGRRGVNMGPSAMRVAGLHDKLQRLGYEVTDHGDLFVRAPETESAGPSNAKYLPLISDVCERLCFLVEEVMAQEGFPIVLGGDHSIAIGTISGIAATLHERTGTASPSGPPRLGVIWFDAHGDINRPDTSPSGNIHGMPVACLLGQGPPELSAIAYPGAKIEPSKFCQIGLRDLDIKEKRLLRESGIHTYTMADIDRRGLAPIVEEAIAITSEGTDLLHCSFDIDSVDPHVAPGTGTPKLGGLTYREAHLALEMIAECGRLTSLEMVEVNPALDHENRTAGLAVELIASALGERIL
jgi:arginase